MGLAPIHLLPGEASPEIIAATAADAKGVPVHKPQRSVQVAPNQPLPMPQVAVEEPARWSGAAKFGIAMLILLFAGAVGFGTWRLANMVGQTAPIPQAKSEPVATIPTLAPEPIKNDAPKPATAPTGVSSEAKPHPTEPSTPEVVPQVEPASAFRDEIAAALRSDAPDTAGLTKRVEQWKASDPAHAADADALLDLIRRRAEQVRLRKTP